MPTSEARIQANRANALKSCGPKTVEGKEQSRRNALKHGLAGAGVVLPEADAAEVDRKAQAYVQELNVTDEIGRDLARQAALSMVRMNRAADQQTAALSERVRQAEIEAEANGEDPAEAGRRAMFDPSKEATLARKYEAAAERSFFRCIKELRQSQKQDRPSTSSFHDQMKSEAMGSFSSFAAEMMGSIPPAEMTDEEYDALCVKLNIPLPLARQNSAPRQPSRGEVDVPITVGRGR